MPALNETGYIRNALDSLLAQDHPDIDEILVVDGGSTDGTREVVAAVGGRVRLVDNPKGTAAAAMNVGIAAARNNLIVRADAHTRYEADYVSKSVEHLRESGADWVGGRMNPVGDSEFGKAVTVVTTSPVGVGPGRFHYLDEPTDVDTVYLGAFDRRIVTEVGGYDEDGIQWAAEDQELAYRLRLAGRRIRLEPSIKCWYVPRGTPRALWRQYYNYGMCKASTVAKHHALPSWRPIAPAGLILFLLSGIVPALRWRRPSLIVVPAASYAAISGTIARRLARGTDARAHRVTAAMWICHVAYGLGFWNGVSRWWRGIPFDSRPNSNSPQA